MAGRYLELYKLPRELFVEGSPVIIEAGALLKDANDKILAQIKIRNISSKKIISCKVMIEELGADKKELGSVEHNYLDLDAEYGHYFGTKVPIYLSEKLTRVIKVYVENVLFSDGTTWNSSTKSWDELEPAKVIETQISNNKLVRQYKKEIGKNCKYYPERMGALCRCTCGSLSPSANAVCYQCNSNFNDALNKLDEKYLSKRAGKRILSLLLCILPVIIVAFILISFGVKETNEKKSAYNDAILLMNRGYYLNAIDEFEKLGEYSDSQEKIKEINTRLFSNVDYVIPPVLIDEDFDLWIGRMEKEESELVKDYYMQLCIDKLPKRYNEEDVIRDYPIIETVNVIYVLRDFAKDGIKRRLEKAFSEAGYTLEDYKKDYMLDRSGR